MKKLVKLIACAAVVAMPLAASAADPIHFGVAAEPYPPFAEKSSDGEWHGFEIDLIHDLCKRMATECVIDEVAWDGIIPALLAKKIDVIFASMSITEERQKQIAFSDAYYDTPVGIAAPESMEITLSKEGMEGKAIGVQVSTVSSAYLDKYYAAVADVRHYDTQDSVNADLEAGRIDMMMADATAVDAFVKSDGAKAAGLVKKMEVPHDPLFGNGVGAGLRKEDTELKAKLDTAIEAMLATPEYEQLSEKYFGFSVKPKM